MPEDVYEQLLKIPPSQLTELALAGLRRQGEMVAQVIENGWGQVGNVAGAPSVERIYLVGCGDSYFAALSARLAFEQLTGLPTVALESMEFAHYTLMLPDSLLIVISSTGEVAMTLEAGRAARQAGVEVLGITARQDSRMGREFPCLIVSPGLPGRDHAAQAALILGNFSFSLVALYLLAIHMGRNRGHLDDDTVAGVRAELKAIPHAIEQAMDCSTAIHDYLGGVSDEADFYFLGAGPSHGVALFYQAKFFEQAQRPVYGVELEEFTHEQFFLLRPDGEAHVWFIVPPGRSRERAREVMAGCREMGARVVAITASRHDRIQQEAHATFPVETTSEMFSPLVSVVPGELLGIHAFARWGGEVFSTSGRGRQMAIGKRLTRKGESEE